MGYVLSVHPLDGIVCRSRGNSKRRVSVGFPGSCVGIDGGYIYMYIFAVGSLLVAVVR